MVSVRVLKYRNIQVFWDGNINYIIYKNLINYKIEYAYKYNSICK